MPTECNPTSMRFARLKGRDVVADFGGGTMTSDAGALLLGTTDRAIGLVARFSACFSDGRSADRVVHDVEVLVGQRVFGIALGYEDVVDHDELRRDPVLGVVLGRLEARRRDCAPLAGKSTLNRLEHAPAGAHRYSATMGRRSRRCSWTCFSTPTSARRNGWCSTSTPRTIRCTGARRAASSTAITTATATCRSTSSAATTSWRRSSGRPTSTPAPAVEEVEPSADPCPLAGGRDRAAADSGLSR